MYVRTSFRGAKTCKIRKKGVFLVKLANFGKDMTDKLRKTHAKHVFRVFFHAQKICVRVCFESPFTRMISSLKYKCPPPPPEFYVTYVMHSMQHNREQIALSYFEVWFFLNTLICFLSLLYNVISDWFSNIFLQKNPCIFCSLSHPNYRKRKLLRLISQNHTSRETAYGRIHKWSYLKK